MFRIMVVEDEALLKELIIESISTQEDFQCVGETDNASRAVWLCEKILPDLILMDIKLDDSNGIEAAAEIKARFPEVKILILTALSSESTISRAMAAGADGYVLKSTSVAELINIVRHTAGGAASTPVLPPKQQCKPVQFSTLEIDILQLLSEGKTARDVAQTLHFSHGTVRNYISGMISRMGFSDRVQLVSFAITEGLIN